jgi:hypothetical protein
MIAATAAVAAVAAASKVTLQQEIIVGCSTLIKGSEQPLAGVGIVKLAQNAADLFLI